MELWDSDSKLCEIEHAQESHHREVIFNHGQAKPVEILRFVDLWIPISLTASLGDSGKYFVKDENGTTPISIFDVIPSQRGSIIRIHQPISEK